MAQLRHILYFAQYLIREVHATLPVIPIRAVIHSAAIPDRDEAGPVLNKIRRRLLGSN